MSFYPDAKIILTTRSTQSWYTSMSNTIVASLSVPVWILGYVGIKSHAVSIFALVQYWFDNQFYGNFYRFGKRAFEDHNERIKLEVEARGEKERLLVFEVKEGWGPLCMFLGKEAPKGKDGAEVGSPRVNDTLPWRTMAGMEGWAKMKRGFGMIATIVPVVVGAVMVRVGHNMPIYYIAAIYR
jgi:hypothetical protein